MSHKSAVAVKLLSGSRYGPCHLVIHLDKQMPTGQIYSTQIGTKHKFESTSVECTVCFSLFLCDECLLNHLSPGNVQEPLNIHVSLQILQLV